MVSIEKSLQAYRVLNTPTDLSWKQHWVNEKYSNIDLLKCTRTEQLNFSKRLEECLITICSNIKQTTGEVKTLKELIKTIVSESNKSLNKLSRNVIYSTANGQRPVGKTAFDIWNGFQVIDMDIKNELLARQIKEGVFKCLNKCNWFLGVTLSSSGKGLHIYTKITVPQQDDAEKRKLLYLTNFRHKYSFVYIAVMKYADVYGYTKEDVVKWMDLAMFKPQQGAFIGYDAHPLINTNFFEDFIYVNFDNVEGLGCPDLDWMTYPDLKEIFKRWEWFEEDEENLDVEVISANDPNYDTHVRIHYKHADRWRLANTLVKLYGLEKGYKYLRRICSSDIKDKELQADCATAARHKKAVDVWAVNRLNTTHGFNIKLNISDTNFDEKDIFISMDKISNPTLIRESRDNISYNIGKDQYLGNIRHLILNNLGRITLLEAGAGVGKTEMVKSIVNDGKKIMMVMPFTSTIKSKVENDKKWTYSYGGKQPKLDIEGGLALTVDKFSHLNLMDIKVAGFDYIFIDESHLLFQSEYRPVMAKVVELIRNSEVPIIMMSGTPSGELVFFPDIKHIKVIKEDVRKKEFRVNLVETTQDLVYHMCRQMANDIAKGRRVLFPTNKGTLYSKRIKAAVTFFLEHEHMIFDEVNLQYYKKSNLGEKFMDDINFQKTIAQTQILLCSNYLSVGVDILDRYNFTIYFADLMMPQEVEQFANRLRSNDLFINLYIAKNDDEGNTRSIHKFKEMNFKLNDEEIKNVHSILRICNSMIERNPVEYKYNSLVSSIIHDNKFIEYNDIENKYYLNEIAYKLIYFERKYREYVQQLPVLMKGMQAYGYNISSRDLKEFQLSEVDFMDLKTIVKSAYDDELNLNTTYTEELLGLITDDRLNLYKEVLNGSIDIRKGDIWKEDITNKKMYVKSVEVFEKVVPIFLSMSKQYEVKDIKEIFEFCRSKNGSFNFSAIKRLRLLINILYNNKQNRLDLPIKEFMEGTYKFIEGKRITEGDIKKFIMDFATNFAQSTSTEEIIIPKATMTMELLYDQFEKIFNCLVTKVRKKNVVKLQKVELLWKEKEYYTSTNLNENVFILEEFLGTLNPTITEVA